jgi:two-component system, OmpR family, KDP operon response regulator KdpE
MDRKNKILIIDDEPDIRKLLKISFESNNYSVEEAGSAAEGIKLLPLVQPQIVLLDLGLPDMDGLEVLIKIRSWSDIPVIVLSVRNDEHSIVNALDNGANDYLTKPFNVGELFARVRAIFRNKIKDSHVSIFESGTLRIDYTARIATVKGQEIKLTLTEYNLLCLFVRNAGKVLTHSFLLKEVWGSNSVEHSQYLRVYVGHLRQKIEEEPNKPQIIITEPGIGYRFNSKC